MSRSRCDLNDFWITSIYFLFLFIVCVHIYANQLAMVFKVDHFRLVFFFVIIILRRLNLNLLTDSKWKNTFFIYVMSNIIPFNTFPQKYL